MTEPWRMAWAFMAGLCSGALFFGGLWLTVRRLKTWRRPEWAILLSFVARAALVLAVFWRVSRDGPLPISLCLAGFLAARMAFIRTIGARRAASPEPREKPCA